jgi:hypothetical protein
MTGRHTGITAAIARFLKDCLDRIDGNSTRPSATVRGIALPLGRIPLFGRIPPATGRIPGGTPIIEELATPATPPDRRPGIAGGRLSPREPAAIIAGQAEQRQCSAPPTNPLSCRDGSGIGAMLLPRCNTVAPVRNSRSVACATRHPIPDINHHHMRATDAKADNHGFERSWRKDLEKRTTAEAAI